MNEILVMDNISKYFPGVTALNKVHFDLRAGEVHAIVGENGAGKSTLMKILTGSYQPDEGHIEYMGKEVQFNNPRTALEMGISIVHQEVHIIPDITVAENIFIGYERRSPWMPLLYDFKTMNQEAAAHMEVVGLKVSPTALAGTLSLAQQQMLTIARIFTLNNKIVIFDEPTAALASVEVEALFNIIKKLKDKGIGIVYISHRLEELDVIADRVSVYRDGTYVKTLDYKDTNKAELISLMVGRELTNQYPCHHTQRGNEILRVNRLTTANGLKIEDLSLNSGEILGIYGLVGAGRTEFARALFAADATQDYDVELFGKPIRPKSPVDAVKQGIGYLSEDRKKDGLALGLDIEKNITLANLKGFSKLGVMRKKTVIENTNKQVKNMRIRTPSIYQIACFLSGGNQQKLIIGKWLSCHSRILIFDEPTRGIDVGARKEIYDLLVKLVEQGVGIIIISSDLPEVIGVSDVIAVMHDMHITGIVEKDKTNQEELLALAVK